MTDQRSWLWRRRSSEKNTVVSEKQYLPSKANDEEIHILLAEKAELERDLKDLSDKLSLALSECNANNELAKKNAKMAQEALEGWEKAEAMALSLKEELEEALERRAAYEERTIQVEAALKECMQQLRFVREEKEQRIHDVLTKLAKDYDEKRLVFEEKMSESSRKIAELQSEIADLSEVIFLKEQLVEELNQKKAQVNADLKELSTRLESTEKRNASLEYEVRVLERELQIRNEEKEFTRQTANATHKQHLENVKKIAKLDSECQRLRVLVQKRFPSPAAMTRMKNEVEMPERRPSDTRRRTIANGNNSPPESPAKKINLLAEKLHALEEENNALRETLEKKTDALQISRNMYAQASVKLTQAEAQLEELSKTQMIMDLTTSASRRVSRDMSRASVSDFGCDDKVSCAWSSASTLISELTEKGICGRSPRSNAVSSEINLMDDFVEMEKLALVCADKPIESSPISETKRSLGLVSVDAAGKQIVPVSSISKLIRIIEGISFQDSGKSSLTNNKNSDATTEYAVHAFQWKTPDVAGIIQRFLHVCYDLLNGKVDFGRFSEEVASTLEWMINHCVSLQDVSSMNEKQLGWESELEAPCLSVASTSGYHGAIPLLHIQSNLKEEIGRLKDRIRELEYSKKEVEEKLEAVVDDRKSLSTQLENKKLENEALNTKLSAAKMHLDDAGKTLLSLEAEAEFKTKHSEKLEVRCNELQIQLASATTKGVEQVRGNEDEKQLRNNWDVTAASEKLAQCQETIISLGKQLKATSSPCDTVLLDKAVSTLSKTPPPPTASTSTTPREKGSTRRPSLLDKMLAEDYEELPQTKETTGTPEPLKLPPGYPKGSINPTFESDWTGQSFTEADFAPLPLVPSKKKQKKAGLFKKLLWKRKKGKGKSKKLDLAFSTC